MLRYGHLFILILISILTIFCGLLVGEYPLDLSQNLLEGKDFFVFSQYRAPRVLLSYFVGAGLALAGLLFQSLFRNSLMTPFTLGVAGTSSLGTALWIHLGTMTSLGFFGLHFSSLLGAGLGIIFLFLILKIQKKNSLKNILLFGIGLNMFCSSLVMLIQLISKEANAQRIVRWLVGGVDVSGSQSFYFILPFILIVFFWSLKNHLSLDLLSMGDDIAASRGMKIQQFKSKIIILVSLMIAFIVAECGPISFVGIIIPHIARRFTKNTFRHLLVFSFCFGGIFLCLMDLFLRYFNNLADLPVGILTSLIGGPLFIFILLSKNRF